MPKLPFVKMHGCGNDYIYVVANEIRPADPASLSQRISDRRFGIGGDGLIMLCPSAKADVRMEMYNADGSRGEMCGNGIRCVARLYHQISGGRKNPVAVETDCGIKTVQLAFAGESVTATVDMGEPILEGRDIPTQHDGRVVDYPLEVEGRVQKVTAVSMGNPHAVTFVGSRDEALALAPTVGPAVERHAWFPNRTNAEFAHVKHRREIDLVVWERGCGITLACGTGACATAVAAVVTGRADEATPIRVNLVGGSLEITVHPGLSAVSMKGPALHVFDGELDLARLQPRPA